MVAIKVDQYQYVTVKLATSWKVTDLRVKVKLKQGLQLRIKLYIILHTTSFYTLVQMQIVL